MNVSPSAPGAPGAPDSRRATLIGSLAILLWSLLALLTAWAGGIPPFQLVAMTFAVAIARMGRALDELAIVGIATSQPFHRRVMHHQPFLDGLYDIGYLEAHATTLLGDEEPLADMERIAVAAALAEHGRRHTAATMRLRHEPRDGTADSPWLRAARLGGRR